MPFSKIDNIDVNLIFFNDFVIFKFLLNNKILNELHIIIMFPFNPFLIIFMIRKKNAINFNFYYTFIKLFIR